MAATRQWEAKCVITSGDVLYVQDGSGWCVLVQTMNPERGKVGPWVCLSRRDVQRLMLALQRYLKRTAPKKRKAGK